MKNVNANDSSDLQKQLSIFDIQDSEKHGISVETIARQWRFLREGVPYSHLEKPCVLGEGVVSFSEPELASLAALFDEQRQRLKVIKFVPASGVASRMFSDWRDALNSGGFAITQKNEAFLRDLPRYAFYPMLGEALGAQRVAEMRTQGDVAGLLRTILDEPGLGYTSIPKALLAFHRYGGAINTPLEEHLREATHYCADGSGYCRVHFTVSMEHQEKVEAFLKEILNDCERIFKVKFLVDLSVQSLATDTVALDEKGELARSANGKLLFRAGGHGALLKNLQALRGDVIFIGNIDNVVHSSRLGVTIKYKKALGGYLLKLLAERNRLLGALQGECSDVIIDEAVIFCANFLNRRFTPSFAIASSSEKAAQLKAILTRPLRVCGVVSNEGEQGGAPFWVQGNDGSLSQQIVESFQVDIQKAAQQKIWQAARYFNPVDIACSINNVGGDVFDLDEFANEKAVSISQKQDGGRNLRVLELPGLWNGAMARWNSVFVAVPLATFNPVKTIEDLLRSAHCEA